MKIYFVNGPRKDETLEMQGPALTVGRETDNTISLLVGGVSRYHSKFELHGTSWLLSDLGSTNGTKVNGIKIAAPQELKPGDMIYFGDQHVKVFENSPDESSGFPPIIETTSGTAAGEIKILSPEPMENSGIKAPEPLDAVESVFKRQPQMTSPTARTIPDINGLLEQEQEPSSYFAEVLQPTGESVHSPLAALSKINFFGKKGKTQTTETEHEKPRKHANALFYVSVIGLAVIFISIYFVFDKIAAEKIAIATAQKQKAVKEKSPFLLIYRKQVIKNNNIFYFSLSIEHGNVVFTVDDLKADIHYTKTIENAEESRLNEIEQLVRGTSFMALKQDNSPGPAKPESIRTIIAGYDDNLNEITVKDNFASSSFESIEVAVDEFASNYDLRTISLTPEELKSEAEKAFTKAEELFTNEEARPENLREAIARYKMAVEFLNPFSPKPPMWNSARKKQQEATAVLEKRIKDIDFDFRKALQMDDYSRALELSSQMLLTADPYSKTYVKYKKVRMELESKMRSLKKK
ncbi:MAG: hypothetical protein A2020_05095 [Lentisphaerae bacterium GWF2_45_14]|nr:MAG: hypothetical protein A2020_05095 [Lentisphaerae bacterium GWF2_45_14]